MSKLAAWATILGSLVVGAVAGNLLVRSAGDVLPLSTACVLLSTAQEAGHLDDAKRARIAKDVAASTALSDKDRELAAKLANSCPKI